MVQAVVPMRAAQDACLHCGLPVGAGEPGDFCCRGCEAVYGLLHEEGLDGYYALRGARGVPVTRPGIRRDTKWLELVEERVRASSGPTRVTFDLQGLHCVACVWLVDELFRRAPGAEHVEVNPSLGRVDMVVAPAFDVRGFVEGVERFGYLFGPPIKRPHAASNDLLWRMGITVAIAMNSMIFGIAIYAGLDRGPLFELFTTLNFGLGAVAVAVGGSVFFRSAWTALRRRLLHLDLPIALGITLAFAGSAYSYFARHSESAYFDTLDVFIALMLVGRFLQERAIERNRAWLLESDGTEGLLTRRIADGRVALVRCAEVAAGDALLVAPGDLVPVDARLEAEGGTFSLDWIVGESRPREYHGGECVPAGAFAAGDRALVVRAKTSFDESPLRDLLRTPARPPEAARTSPWYQTLSKVYVGVVLAVAAAGFAAWWVATRDVTRAFGVATAVLIVTCPCAFGIAAPLGYEIVQAGLRRKGLFVRRASFLDRACDVRRVVFDKTGTLSTGALSVQNPEVVRTLDPEARQALYDLVARSGHPKSAAVREALAGSDLVLDPAAHVVEHPGRGLETTRGRRCFRLGEPAWVAADARGDVAFGADGRALASLVTTEPLRADAAREVQALQADGYDVWLLSGDAPGRVEVAATAAGIARERAVGGASPQDKARFLDAHDAGETLFVGDGVNDALALDHAHASGTPSVDRPYVPARADFFFVTPGLAPVRLALRAARALARVVRADLTIALTYNVVTVGLALAGQMSPLLCAVLMPLSSLTTVAATVAALSPRRRLWRS